MRETTFLQSSSNDGINLALHSLDNDGLSNITMWNIPEAVATVLAGVSKAVGDSTEGRDERVIAFVGSGSLAAEKADLQE